MNWQAILVIIFLTIGVSVVLLCCVGIMIAKNAYARIHFIGPATIIGSISLFLAVLVQEGLSQASLKAFLIALTLLITSPVLSHATARAILASGNGIDESALNDEADSKKEKT